MTKIILSHGGGLDSNTILAMLLEPEKSAAFLGITKDQLDKALPRPDLILFSDTGAEKPITYDHINKAKKIASSIGIPFKTIEKQGHTLLTWLNKNHNLPLMPGAKHVCSLKFKGEVLQRYARNLFGVATPTKWLIGIEASESSRVARFQAAAGEAHNSIYPLTTLGITRGRAHQLIKAVGFPFTPVKSSCFCCPFMSISEIYQIYIYYPNLWTSLKKIEFNFKRASFFKHAAWLAAGKPMHGTHAPPGMWSRNSWREGARLFSKTINGKRLSVEEWETHFNNNPILDLGDLDINDHQPLPCAA